MCDKKADLSAVLLDWYDVAARGLPWRVSPRDRARGVRPNPYRIWLSEVMLQQTTVAAVGKYYYEFTRRWPDIFALSMAKDSDVMAAWAGLGYYARARNLLKCAREIAGAHQGHFPSGRAALQTLPGIGPYTASAIAAIAFDAPETVVDGNVERVMARFHACCDPLPAAKKQLYRLAEQHTPVRRAGDYAQAVMDLGAMVCTPKSPACAGCPLRARCKGYARGLAQDLPYRQRALKKPLRHGIIHVVKRRDGALLLERRPKSGLLGGMLGWPGGEWCARPRAVAPINANWITVPGEVRHTFTHFHLRLQIRRADVGFDAVPTIGEFISEVDFCREDLPTVMRKVYDLAMRPTDPADKLA